MDQPSMLASWLKLILGFPLVILLIYVSVKLASRMQTKMQVGQNMEVIERLGVSKNVQLMIIRLGQSYHMASVSQDKVVLLERLDFVPQTPKKMTEDQDFKEILDKMVRKVRKKK